MLKQSSIIVFKISQEMSKSVPLATGYRDFHVNIDIAKQNKPMILPIRILVCTKNRVKRK